MKLNLPLHIVKLADGREVRAKQVGHDQGAHIELRLWVRNRRRGWAPTDHTVKVPCGDLAMTWDRMTTELSRKLEDAVHTMERDTGRGD